MSKEESRIKPQLFEVKTEYDTHYVIAYDSIHAITSCFSGWGTTPDIKSIKKLTDKFGDHLIIAKECLSQGLVTKIVKE
mgnify:CR=1 FL=1